VGGEFDGVADEVEEDLAEACGVGVDGFGNLGIAGDGEGEAFGLGVGAGEGVDVAEDLAEGGGNAGDGELAGFDA